MPIVSQHKKYRIAWFTIFPFHRISIFIQEVKTDPITRGPGDPAEKYMPVS
jgi:hypothetical protein